LPKEHELAASAPAAEIAAAAEPDAPAPIAVAASVPDVAVAEVAPAIELPKPQALAIAQPGSAPTKRTVKIIPVGPDGVTESAAATAAAVAVAPATAAPIDTAAVEPADILAFANPATGTPRALEVNDNLVNVRSGPSTESDKLWVLKRGDEVQALAVSGDWVEVEISEGKVGWMLSQFLTDADLTGLPEREAPAAAEPVVAEAEVAPAAEPEALETEVVAEAISATAPDQLVAEATSDTATDLSGDVRTVRGAGVNVRSSPSSSAAKLFALPGGRKVSVSETQRGWLKVTDDQGRTGWLYEDYVSGN
jgi:uncharacterized protein YgiM (DUF1202 family)